MSRAGYSFASDNTAGVHPEVFAAMAAVADGQDVPYGDDACSLALDAWVPEVFGAEARLLPVLNGTGAEARLLPVLNGTGANVLALSALAPRGTAVVYAASSHLHTDEAGAPILAGLPLILLPTADGKLTPEQLKQLAAKGEDQHHEVPSVVSIAQVTELGTAYTPAEVAALSGAAHAAGWKLHVDGSRLANAAAHLGVAPRELVAGVDAVSLGATKNGAMLAEAVLCFDEASLRAARRLRKASLQLVSKQRYVSAQLEAMWRGELWRRNAARANSLTATLAAGLTALPGVRATQAVQSNALFVELPAAWSEELRSRFFFHGAGTAAAPARLMCSFDTPEEAVEALLDAARKLSERG